MFCTVGRRDVYKRQLQKCAVKISPRAEKFKNSTAELIFCMLLLAYSVMLMVSSTYSAFIYMNF